MKRCSSAISTFDLSAGIEVVAAVIERRGRYLLAQRPSHKAHGGLWEFPGGKVDAGETLAAALARELVEELALGQVVVGRVLGQQTDSTAGLRLHFLQVETDQAPIALEHAAIGWYKPAEMSAVQLAPLDRGFVGALGSAKGWGPAHSSD